MAPEGLSEADRALLCYQAIGTLVRSLRLCRARAVRAGVTQEGAERAFRLWHAARDIIKCGYAMAVSWAEEHLAAVVSLTEHSHIDGFVFNGEERHWQHHPSVPHP